MAKGFTGEKVQIHIQDGFQYLKDHINSYQVIICDLSDPDGNF